MIDKKIKRTKKINYYSKGARDSFLEKSRAKNKGFKGAEAPLAEALVLRYDCNEVKSGEKGDDKNGDFFSWCPIKYNSRKTKKNIKGDKGDKGDKDDDIKGEVNNELLRAADKYENIRIGKWYNGKFNINKAVSKKFDKGYCHSPIKTQKFIIPLEEDEKNQAIKKYNQITVVIFV